MSKCPNCGVEVESGAKFCMECGTKIPQTKECPACHSQWPLTAKFCAECGYNFNAGGTKGGPVIGDKNVIAGDVTTTVTNTTYINQDETKKVVKCVVCGRAVVVTEAFTCSKCGEYVCEEHYDKGSLLCFDCLTEKVESAEAEYRKTLDVILEDGIVDKDEFEQLERLRKKLGIPSTRAMELQKKAKSERLAKDPKADTQLMTVEKAQCERAKTMLYDSGDFEGACNLIQSIYRNHPLNEEVLSIYLTSLMGMDEDNVKAVVSSLPIDIVCAYVALVDLELRHGDLAAAEVRLAAAEKLWPDNMQVKFRRVALMCATARQFNDRTYLAEAMDILTSLPAAGNKIEKSWQVFLQYSISWLLGDEVSELTEAFCIKEGLYYALVNGELLDIKLNVYDVVLNSASNRIAVIKIIRSLLDLGLKDAKDLVESAPTTVKTVLTEDEAKRIADDLSNAGAITDVRKLSVGMKEAVELTATRFEIKLGSLGVFFGRQVFESYRELFELSKEGRQKYLNPMNCKENFSGLVLQRSHGSSMYGSEKSKIVVTKKRHNLPPQEMSFTLDNDETKSGIRYICEEGEGPFPEVLTKEAPDRTCLYVARDAVGEKRWMFPLVQGEFDPKLLTVYYCRYYGEGGINYEFIDHIEYGGKSLEHCGWIEHEGRLKDAGGPTYACYEGKSSKFESFDLNSNDRIWKVRFSITADWLHIGYADVTNGLNKHEKIRFREIGNFSDDAAVDGEEYGCFTENTEHMVVVGARIQVTDADTGEPLGDYVLDPSLKSQVRYEQKEGWNPLTNERKNILYAYKRYVPFGAGSERINNVKGKFDPGKIRVVWSPLYQHGDDVGLKKEWLIFDVEYDGESIISIWGFPQAPSAPYRCSGDYEDNPTWAERGTPSPVSEWGSWILTKDGREMIDLWGDWVNQ